MKVKFYCKNIVSWHKFIMGFVLIVITLTQLFNSMVVFGESVAATLVLVVFSTIGFALVASGCYDLWLLSKLNQLFALPDGKESTSLRLLGIDVKSRYVSDENGSRYKITQHYRFATDSGFVELTDGQNLSDITIEVINNLLKNGEEIAIFAYLFNNCYYVSYEDLQKILIAYV